MSNMQLVVDVIDDYGPQSANSMMPILAGMKVSITRKQVLSALTNAKADGRLVIVGAEQQEEGRAGHPCRIYDLACNVEEEEEKPAEPEAPRIRPVSSVWEYGARALEGSQP